MKTRFFTLAARALALVACNNDNENLNGDPVAAQFTANIAPATRASGTTWTGGDRIGITDIGNDSQYGNVPFILKNGKFEAEGKVIYIEDAKTHTFRAYSPYNAVGKERSSISKMQRPILSAPTIRTTRREASSQPRPMPRRSKTSLPSTSSLLQEPRETKTTR